MKMVNKVNKQYTAIIGKLASQEFASEQEKVQEMLGQAQKSSQNFALGSKPPEFPHKQALTA